MMALSSCSNCPSRESSSMNRSSCLSASLRRSARQIKRGRRKRPAGHVVPRLATRHNPRGSGGKLERRGDGGGRPYAKRPDRHPVVLLRLGRRSEEHTSELQSLMRISYAVFCLTKNNKQCSFK